MVTWTVHPSLGSCRTELAILFLCHNLDSVCDVAVLEGPCWWQE